MFKSILFPFSPSELPRSAPVTVLLWRWAQGEWCPALKGLIRRSQCNPDLLKVSRPSNNSAQLAVPCQFLETHNCEWLQSFYSWILGKWLVDAESCELLIDNPALHVVLPQSRADGLKIGMPKIPFGSCIVYDVYMYIYIYMVII